MNLSTTEKYPISENQFLLAVENEVKSLIDENASGDLLDICHYHLGIKGKMIRSKFVYGLGKIYHCAPEKLIGWATTIELLHEASLVHDDYQDGDEIRRGSLAVWKKYGGANAINVGDFLIMLAYRPLEKLGVDFLQVHSNTSYSLVQGQVDELYLNNFKLSADYYAFYLRCIKGKTGALFSSIAEGISIIAGLEQNAKLKMIEAFIELGIIFQIQDDLLDLYGDKKRGFQGADIKEGKCSALVALHLDNFSEDLRSIKSILLKSREETSEQDILLLKNLFLEKGSLKMATNKLYQHVEKLEKLASGSKFEIFINQAINKILEPINQIL